MNTVDTLGVSLVAISERDFVSLPQDRSLQHLSLDARALRRRAVKGVGVEIQRGLFVQVARRIDGLALERVSQETYRMTGTEAEAWLQLDVVLGRVPLAGLLLPPPAPAPPPAPVVVPPASKGVWGMVRSLFGQTPPPPPAVPPPAPKPVVIQVPVLGEQVLFPGQEVSGWHTLLRAIDPKCIRSSDPLWGALSEDRCVSLLRGVSNFFAAAHSKRAAVIQVLSDVVVST